MIGLLFSVSMALGTMVLDARAKELLASAYNEAKIRIKDFKVLVQKCINLFFFYHQSDVVSALR